MQKHIGFMLVIIALGIFVPGVLLTMFSLNMEMAIKLPGTSLSSELLNKELSIITTIEELWLQQRYLVAILIFVFSVIIPIFKTIIVSIVYFTKNLELQSKLISFVSFIGKWSMADVFVVAVFLAVLSSNHASNAEQHAASFFGMSIGFEISTQTISSIGEGFYYFVGYCLISMIGTQLVHSAVNKKSQTQHA